MKGVPGSGSGRPRAHVVRLVSLGKPNALGNRLATLECVDAHGSTRWIVFINTAGVVVGKVKKAERERYAKHAKSVRRAVEELAAKEVERARKQTELPFEELPFDGGAEVS